MAERLTKKEALEFLGLEEKTFENYFLYAKEFPCNVRANGKGRYYFDKEVLKQWKESSEWRTVELDIEDYTRCLDFALAQHFRGYVASDWGTGRQREFGQKITNWVKGQLGEVAVQKFLKQKFNIDVALDFEIREDIVPQDIVGVSDKGVLKAPGINVAIKSSKPKNSYLVLSFNEKSSDRRKSDVYVFCRPNLPDDHLLRITKKLVVDLVRGEQHFSTYADLIPSFGNIRCEIAGFVFLEELDEVTEIPGQKFDGPRFVKESGKLHRSIDEWRELAKRLQGLS